MAAGDFDVGFGLGFGEVRGRSARCTERDTSPGSERSTAGVTGAICTGAAETGTAGTVGAAASARGGALVIGDAAANAALAPAAATTAATGMATL